MDRMILVRLRLRRVSLDTTLREVFWRHGVTLFNEQQFHLVGIDVNHCWDGYVTVAIYNPNFPLVPEKCGWPRYELDEARRRFPYLFSKETNPILWWRFEL